ncbi:sensor histidine kinase [Nonomuraea cavernae]|uniref:sensor histidine kinase n=1 Tax=Nonomuraea cavernae TaxID=2045107 RepID=UPI00166C8BF1|nr:ATP-binding protein [Nonomuraea cavernae]MCA2190164.1 HAMP domain-containing protein [Nonomuraea cavernae]
MVLIPIGIGAVILTRSMILSNAIDDTVRVAERVAAQVQQGTYPQGANVPAPAFPVNLVQIVSPDGRIVATSDEARTLPRLSNLMPTPEAPVLSGRSCLPDRCVVVTAVRPTIASGSPIIYVGRVMPAALVTHTLDIAVLVETVALIGLTGLAAWLLMGRALRPVAVMGAELDRVSASDLSARVTRPPGDDELSALAERINGTLSRLEHSAEQQRQFVSDASHELRTPIAGLRAELESAQLYPDDTDLRELVEKALRDIDRLEMIMSDLLFLARTGARVDVAWERLDLAELVREVMSTRRDRVPVRLDLADDVAVHGVKGQLTRALTDLLNNAERYAEHYIRIEVSRREGKAVIAVENDGMEIPEGDRERIFEPFSRLDTARSREAGGTGLGLAIVKSVAVAHAGHARVDDFAGGARFLICLPAV